MNTSINNKVLGQRLVLSLLALSIGWFITPAITIQQPINSTGLHPDNILKWTNAIIVLWNNLKVGLLLTVLGYFTAGFCSILILIWNGMLFRLSMLATISIHPTLTIPEIIVKYFPHAFTELFALGLFASLGMSGFSFYKSIYSKRPFSFPIKSTLVISIIAFSLLILSSIIEVYA